VPDGLTPQQHLEQLTWEGAAKRYPEGISDKVRHTLEQELALIGRLNYAPYFLTVHDIVRFAEGEGILCQGRGSAANSVVCYCLRITAVNPIKVDLLFERFVSAERNEPPDIDVDFEHERREEVIQYIYRKYGRHRAGLAATVISYRPKSALRDVGKVFGLSEDVLNRLSKAVWGWGEEDIVQKHIRQAGLDPDEPRLGQVLALAGALIGFPRHLSQHVGGFVITRGSLHDYVPIENAAMEDRTVIEWDKDDLDTLRMLKIDVLALGMLTCIRKGFDLIHRHCGGEKLTLANIPPEEPEVYDMLCKADSVGVFQVESRAQMSMLPRLRPRNFYDLVVEVAIVRPGPIQGDMVHPYLRRRDGLEETDFPSNELREVLKKTYGVPLFQEQAMRIAIVAAGFTPAQSDQLRRAMATFRRNGTIGTLKDKFIDGMIAKNYTRDFAERCFKQIEGFGDYGFPESHAASFALLVYVSAWLKCRHPAAFACAILNAQPMGFYAPAQLVRDAAGTQASKCAGRRQCQRLGQHAGTRCRRQPGAAPRLPRDHRLPAAGCGPAGQRARRRLLHAARAVAQERPRPRRAGNAGQGRCLRLAIHRSPARLVADPCLGRRADAVVRSRRSLPRSARMAIAYSGRGPCGAVAYDEPGRAGDRGLPRHRGCRCAPIRCPCCAHRWTGSASRPTSSSPPPRTASGSRWPASYWCASVPARPAASSS
jgi:error-prone DNA polymerase